MAKILAVLMLIAAIGIRYWIRRREFNRRNAFGNEQFASFESKVGTRTIERFMAFIGVALFVFACLVILAVWLINRSLALPQ